MLEKLKQLYVAANNLQPHEDKYHFTLKIASEKNFYLLIEHEYVKKTKDHPIAIIYSKTFEELTDEIIQEIKKKLIDRQLSLIELRKTEAAEQLEKFRRASEELGDRIVHLEQIKKI